MPATGNRMPAVQRPCVSAGPTRGLLLLGGTSILTVMAIVGGQRLLRQRHVPVTARMESAQVWARYRWSIDPLQRREAALLLASRSRDSPERQRRLLAGQGWGPAPLAAVALKQQALAARRAGRPAEAEQRWQSLLERFPTSAASADARYYLKGDDAQLKQQLLSQQPAHPAALAAAAELPDDANQDTLQANALHLARWGPRWPGASSLIRRTCGDITGTGLSQEQRLSLASALAELGDGTAAELCLQGTPLQPPQALIIGRTLWRGTPAQKRRGEAMLLQLATAHPQSDEALAAAALLSEPLRPNQALLDALPLQLQERSADVAAARVRLNADRNGLEVLKQWPDHPAIWQLQWDLARNALLEGQWDQALSVLKTIPGNKLPDPLAARQQFWIGFSLAKLGKQEQAERVWEALIKAYPPGYYTWRAEARLGGGDLPALNGEAAATATRTINANNDAWERQGWSPLNSGDRFVDQLWRLGLRQEAWDTWRSSQATAKPSPQSQLIEGRLRLGVQDFWTGLSRLWRANLRLVSPDDDTQLQLHQSQHPRPLLSEFSAAAQQEAVRLELLLAIARQESRFSPGVQSPVGAVGLLQLMPATAAEMAGAPLSDADLRQPGRNATLGARYLAWLLKEWQGNPWLTVASYNAGPGAAGSWLSQELTQDPELWVERIPYPETRLYTKKVLGNLWAYLRSDWASHDQSKSR